MQLLCWKRNDAEMIDTENTHGGMTLRDYFAGQALGCLTELAATNAVDDYTPDCVASDAYLFADAMLRERERETE